MTICQLNNWEIAFLQQYELKLQHPTSPFLRIDNPVSLGMFSIGDARGDCTTVSFQRSERRAVVLFEYLQLQTRRHFIRKAIDHVSSMTRTPCVNNTLRKKVAVLDPSRVKRRTYVHGNDVRNAKCLPPSFECTAHHVSQMLRRFEQCLCKLDKVKLHLLLR